jgi:hypothetical protein
MSNEGNLRSLERLEVIRKLNGENREWVNSELYRLMYKQDLYILAYERIKSHPGNMTPGTDDETLDGFSLAMIDELIEEMKTERYRCKPVRTAYIPKANGKMRKLGIPIVRSYCPPSRVLSGLRCRRRSADSIPARSTVPYFARAVGSVVVSNGAASACAARR